LLFLGPALVLLGAIVVYPIFFSIGRSFFDANGSHFVGFDNYQEMFTSDATRTAIKNNLIWVVFAPSIVTALGLIFAVLTERVAWSTAFKVAIFMPMAISFLSAGVTWRLIYEQDPQIGLANATVGAVLACSSFIVVPSFGSVGRRGRAIAARPRFSLPRSPPPCAAAGPPVRLRAPFVGPGGATGAAPADPDAERR